MYDIDKKTYLLKLSRPPSKAVLLIESGIRLHTTSYEWPKNPNPSGFAMKCRKHIRTRRLNGITQLGSDRVVCLTFGANETAHHLIIELYDKGQIALCDHNYVILTLLRPRADGDDVRFAVHERYPIENAKEMPAATIDALSTLMAAAGDGDPLRKLLNPICASGPSAISHALLTHGFSADARVGAGFDRAADMDRLFQAVQLAENVLDTLGDVRKGFIIQKTKGRSKKDLKALAAAKPAKSKSSDGDAGGGGGGGATAAAVADADADADADAEKQHLFFDEFQPFLHAQHASLPFQEYPSFDRAADVFFSEIEAQKVELKIIAQEDAALKKLANVRKDHEKRLESLASAQELNLKRAQLIEVNLDLVDQAIRVVNSLLASSMDWSRIAEMVSEAKALDDPVATQIKKLKLETNTIVLSLKPPYDDDSSSSSSSSGGSDSEASDGGADSEDGDADGNGSDPEAAEAASDARRKKKAAAKRKKQQLKQKLKKKKTKAVDVEIDLGISAYSNSRKQYEKKKAAVDKEKRTIESSEQALRNAEIKTEKALKQVQVNAKMGKARKTYWFEKYLWFISSDNYLVVGGRDRQQNEQIVRRYLEKGDIYVHADFHGASTVVIKNPKGGEVPPRTLSEAGQMACTHSSAWDAKITIGSYWVHWDQVSKTAPTGEYLTAGAFMIRGKKNFMPPSQLAIGVGMLFKVDDSCIVNHLNDRKSKQLIAEEAATAAAATATAGAAPDGTAAADGAAAKDAVGDQAGDDGVVADSGKATSEESLEEGGGSSGGASGASGAGGASAGAGGEAEVGASSFASAGAEVAVEAKEEEAQEEKVDEKEEEEEDNAFPDTNIVLKFDQGDSLAMRAESAETVTADTAETPTLADPVERAPSQTRQGLSAKEKRQRKKERAKLLRQKEQEEAGGGGGGGGGDLVDDGEVENAGRGNGKKGNGGGGGGGGGGGKQKGAVKPQTQKGKRGAATKKKRAKQKYADQDEEDRQMAMELLSSAGSAKPQNRKAKRAARKERGQVGSKHIQATGTQGMVAPEAAAAKITESLAPRARGDGDGNWDDERVEAAKDAKHARMREVAAEEEDEEIQKILEDEKIQLLDESERAGVSYLDALTGCPRADDIIQFAIPVCAPLSALNNYKYRVKMLPGTGRKGQAAKTAVHIFTTTREATDRERELIKGVKDTEFTSNLPGKVKVMGGALGKRK